MQKRAKTCHKERDEEAPRHKETERRVSAVRWARLRDAPQAGSRPRSAVLVPPPEYVGAARVDAHEGRVVAREPRQARRFVQRADGEGVHPRRILPQVERRHSPVAFDDPRGVPDGCPVAPGVKVEEQRFAVLFALVIDVSVPGAKACNKRAVDPCAGLAGILQYHTICPSIG